MQKLLSLTRKAISDYGMICDGDKIAVGLSGGKDSMALLAILAAYQKFSPEKFQLVAINVDLGFKDINKQEVKATADYCNSLGVEFVVEPTQIYDVILERKEKSPCSLCSKMRRGALNSVAKKYGCNKLALGHHADDVLETFLLSLIYEGRISTFMPISHMDRINITLIRPFIYVEEKYLSGLARRYELPIIHNPCPQDKNTKREDIKNLVASLDEKYGCKQLMLTALFHPDRNNHWDKVGDFIKKL